MQKNERYMLCTNEVNFHDRLFCACLVMRYVFQNVFTTISLIKLTRFDAPSANKGEREKEERLFPN